jgi:hypothetical protein
MGWHPLRILELAEIAPSNFRGHYFVVRPLRGPAQGAFGAQSQYTKINSPSQTTSTKCQYQATASNAK